MFTHLFHFRLRHNQAYVWHQPCLLFCSESKRTKWRKLHIALELRMPGDLETRLSLRFTRRDSERGSERRMERISSHLSTKSNMAEDESFEVRKQHLLKSYFDLSSTEELTNHLVN